VAEPKLQNGIGAVRLPEKGIPKAAERVKASPADFEYIEQRVQLPP
jgi:hypothetical protein